MCNSFPMRGCPPPAIERVGACRPHPLHDVGDGHRHPHGALNVAAIFPDEGAPHTI